VNCGSSPVDLLLQGRARSLFLDAMLAYDEKRYGDAEALLNDVAKLAPGDSEVSLYLGICRLAEGNAFDAGLVDHKLVTGVRFELTTFGL